MFLTRQITRHRRSGGDSSGDHETDATVHLYRHDGFCPPGVTVDTVGFRPLSPMKSEWIMGIPNHPLVTAGRSSMCFLFSGTTVTAGVSPEPIGVSIRQFWLVPSFKWRSKPGAPGFFPRNMNGIDMNRLLL